MLSVGVILFGGFAKPLYCLHFIFGYPPAIVVTGTQNTLSTGIILFGGFAKPLHRLHFILRHT